MEWNYDNSILNVSAAAHSFCGLPSSYNPLPSLKAWLDDGDFDQLFILMIDGMGESILNKHANPDGLFRAHQIDCVDTVYPTTTAAATTAFLTGKSPKETGWLGWDMYFSEVDDVVMTFLGRGMYSGEDYGKTFGMDTLPVEYIYNRQEERAKAFYPSWSDENPTKNFRKLAESMVETSYDKSIRFSYFYDDELDSLMHKISPENKKIARQIARRERILGEALEIMSETTAVIVLADHGQIASNPVQFAEDIELIEMLDSNPWMDSRIWCFKVKEGCHEAFEEHMRTHYDYALDLFLAKDIANSEMFGPVEAPEHLRFREFLGDYVAIARTNRSFSWGELGRQKGVHSGVTIEERQIPVIAMCNKEEL